MKSEVIVVTERERLIELLKSDSCESPMLCDPNCKYANLKRCYEERTADYLLANGVIVLPVDIIGNTLWFINCDDNIVCDKIDGIAISDRHNVYIFLRNSDDDFYKLSDIGKFLFYTREEAEKALAERSEYSDRFHDYIY